MSKWPSCRDSVNLPSWSSGKLPLCGLRMKGSGQLGTAASHQDMGTYGTGFVVGKGPGLPKVLILGLGLGCMRRWRMNTAKSVLQC
jgi:hypothetical protein